MKNPLIEPPRNPHDPMFVQSQHKTRDEYLAEDIKRARNAIGFLLAFGFSLARTLQLFSRSAGTSHPKVEMVGILGVVLLGCFLFAQAEQHGRIDAVPYEAFIVLLTILWVRSAYQNGRVEMPAKTPPSGRGVLTPWLEGSSPRACGVLSDIVVGIALIGGLALAQCPTLQQGMTAVLVWTCACHAAVELRYRHYLGQIRYVQRRSRRWRRDVRGVHHL